MQPSGISSGSASGPGSRAKGHGRFVDELARRPEGALRTPSSWKPQPQ